MSVKQDIYIECSKCKGKHDNKQTTRLTLHRVYGITVARNLHLCPECASEVMAPLSTIDKLAISR